MNWIDRISRLKLLLVGDRNKVTNHDPLGEITNGDGFDLAIVQYGERSIEMKLIEDEQPFEAVVEFAGTIARTLNELDRTAKSVAARDLRQTYNSGWNEYDEIQEDGTLETVSNPELSEVEFVAKLTLSAINVTGMDSVTFFYDNDEMFWGHSILVHSSDAKFSDAYAELFG